MKNTTTARGTVKRAIAGILAAVSMTTALSSVAVSAAETNAEQPSFNVVIDRAAKKKYDLPQFIGHDILDGTYDIDGFTVDFKYSDGFFENEPALYQHHMASASMALAHSSCTVINHITQQDGSTVQDYSEGPSRLIGVMEQMGFENITASDSYFVKPTGDSIACVIGSKEIETVNGKKKIVQITVRSANYEKEWVSNVTLGREGEAEGFANAADTVFGTYLADYIEQNGLGEALENGEVDFWLTGFSRGGATANLTAKRLIDAYQEQGNKIYAYCIEAPQGGIEAAEKEGADYRGIHNVINVTDLVPYVAPTLMGFKRYGVDHYLSCADHDEYYKKWCLTFSNNYQDNRDTSASEEQVEKVRQQIRYMIPDLKEQEKHMPYTVTGKHFNLDVTKISSSYGIDIQDVEGASTENTIECFVNGLVQQGGVAGRGADRITRDAYVGHHLEDACRRLMEFFMSGKADMKELMSTVDMNSLMLTAFICNFDNIVTETEGYYKSGNFIGAVKSLFGCSNDLDYHVKLTQQNRRMLGDTIITMLVHNKAFKSKLDEQNYPGGSAKALEDLRFLTLELLNTVDRVDDLLTIACNLQGIFQNHSFFQTYAWIRSYDSWFEETAEEEHTPAGDAFAAAVSDRKAQIKTGTIYLNKYTNAVSQLEAKNPKDSMIRVLNRTIEKIILQYGLD